ncbi:MAG: S41 family peptidase [Thermoplasmata archaeon]
MRNLAYNPDIFDNKIAFISGGDVWEYDRAQGDFRKLISGFGVVNNCRYYDHGKKIAFRAMYGESINYADIFSYDRENGSVKRLTYLSGQSVARRMFTDIAGFTPEGRIVVSTPVFQPFSSMTYLYEVEDDGRILRPLNLGPAIHIIYHKGKIYLGRNTFELPHWKGYRGGTRGKIWAGTVEQGFRKLVDLEYHVSSPVIANERIYFIYDGGKHGQICSVDLDGKDFKIHTNFSEYYPRHLNTDGKEIVFSMGGRIFIFNPGNEGIEEIPVGDLYSGVDERVISATKNIEDFDVNDENFLAVVSRGRGIITNDESSLNIRVEQGLRLRRVVFLRGGKVLYVTGDKEGDSLIVYNYKEGKRNEVNHRFGNIYHLVVSKDGTFAALSNDRFEIHLLDLSTGEARLVDSSQEDMITDFDISPDSSYLAYSLPTKKTFFGGYTQRFIRVYDIKDNRTYDVTTDISNDFSPAFSPDGEYLYFLSSRDLDPVQDKVAFNFSYPFVASPYVIPLKEGGVSPLKKDLASLVPRGEKIDLQEAAKRAQSLGIAASDYRRIIPMEGGVLLYEVPVHGEFDSYYSGVPEKGSIKFFDFAERKMRNVKSNVVAFSVSPGRKRLLYKRDDGKIAILKIEKGFGGKAEDAAGIDSQNEKVVNTDNLAMTTSMSQEFLQMYDETWKMMRDHYWEQRRAIEVSDRIYGRYRKLAEQARTRFDLSMVINEMIGEFRTSHCYEMMGEFTTIEHPRAGTLAADFEYVNNVLVVRKVYHGDLTNEKEKSPLITWGVREGDIVEEIDGVPVSDSHVNRFLLGKGGKVVRLKIRQADGREKIALVDVLNDDRYIRYRAWVERNREYVHRKSGNRIGYVHVPDMGMMGLNEFFRLFVNESSYESLIVDVRYNGGGFVSQIILEKIKSERLGYDKPRRGTPRPYPVNSVVGGIAAITNEYAGSDGDIFSHSFKALKIGKLIGTRTWGGVVGINPLRKLIDGTVVTQPEYSFWFKEIGFGVENYGVDPDTEVEFKPEDYFKERDPQLDAAIEILEKETKTRRENLPEELKS